MLRNVLLLICMASVPLACGTSSKGLKGTTSSSLPKTSKVDVAEVRNMLREAILSDGLSTASFEILCARQYLASAEQARTRGDESAANVFAGLAQEQAQIALRKSSVSATQGDLDSHVVDDPQKGFEELRAAYLSVDSMKAAQVAPVLYSQLMLTLSVAEQELVSGKAERVSGALEEAQVYLTAMREQDTDSDGVPDLEDGAPFLPEDMDGFEDEDGVPDADNDQDGILDANDRAPNEPETKNRFHDDDGVPDTYPPLRELTFDLQNGDLTLWSKGYLEGLAIVLKEWPLLKLNIMGFSEESEDLQQNLDNAHRRAMLVRDYLVGLGCDAAQIEVTFREGRSTGAVDSLVILEFR